MRNEMLTPIDTGPNPTHWGINHDTGHGYAALKRTGPNKSWVLEVVWEEPAEGDFPDAQVIPRHHSARSHAKIERGVTTVVPLGIPSDNGRPSKTVLLETVEQTWRHQVSDDAPLTTMGF